MAPNEHLKDIVGGIVSWATHGHGSFLRILINPPHLQKGVLIWIYLANWALLRDDNEILSSDLSPSEYNDRKGQISLLNNSLVKSIAALEGNEVHIDFSGQMRLEIWPSPVDYGEGASLIKIYRNGKFAGEICDAVGLD